MEPAFEKLYSAYFDDVFRYIRKLSGSEHIAEEITADTFFQAMQAIDGFRGDSDVRVWLCQIAKNRYLSYLRKERRVDRIEDGLLLDMADPAEPVEEALIRRDAAAQLQRVLHDLPDPYREVFMWRVYAELSFRQIGQIFGKSENWACVTYHRARARIKERWEETNHEA